jgi:hypothetical protein
MQQTPFQRKLTFITLTTALLSCPATLYAVVIDTDPPTITATTIPDKTYNATGPIVTPEFNNTITPADSIASSVEVKDGVGGPQVTYTFTPTDKVGPLPPGQHIITWTATDLGLNSATANQTLNVLPTINLAQDQTVGEGGTAVVTAYLNGPAPSYPFNVPYTVTGTATGGGVDHNAANGNFVFNNGDTSASVSFSVIADSTSDPNETVIFTLGALPATSVIAGHKDTHTVTISETNSTPLARLTASQGSQDTRAITADGGAVTVTANAYDADGDTVSYDWSASDNALVPLTGSTGNSFSFDPQDLNPGFYTIRLTVSDSKGASSSQDLLLALLSTAPTLSSSLDQDGDGSNDASEGMTDSDNDGIPDYLDANAVPSLIQGFISYTFDPALKQGGTLVNNSITLTWAVSSGASNLILYPLMIAVKPGLQLNLGPTAFAANKSYARLTTAQAETLRNATLADGLVSSDGQVVDIEITGLGQAGDSADVIIPQAAPIPPSKAGTNPAFQVFTSAKQWTEFDTSGGDTIKTDVKKSVTYSYCPDFADMAAAPGTIYQSTLAAGDECVLLHVKDGGPNDYDGVANGSIRLMGNVFITTDSIPVTTTTTSGTFTGSTTSSSDTLDKLDLGTGKGGGVISLPGLFLLLGGLISRRGRRRSAVAHAGRSSTSPLRNPPAGPPQA